MIIILLIIIAILLIYWFQYPELKEDNKRPLWYNVFNKVKLPLCVLGIITLVYLCNSSENSDTNLNNMNIDLSIPNF